MLANTIFPSTEIFVLNSSSSVIIDVTSGYLELGSNNDAVDLD